MVGVGLLYQHGYFRQVIDRDGAQQALYPYNDPGQLPVTAGLSRKGEWLRVEIALPGDPYGCGPGRSRSGELSFTCSTQTTRPISPFHRGITSELYGGGSEMRLQQEIMLGIGGWRLLAAAGIKPEVCHLNEGHAAFALLERARGFMKETGQPFDVALAATRAGNLFTTHTAVAAGFDRFSPELIAQYLGWYAQESCAFPCTSCCAWGAVIRDDPAEPFNMAYLAVRGSGAVNGVSLLHGRVSRHIFAPLSPVARGEVPVGHVTNGVHTPTWDSAESDDLWTEACGKARWLGTPASLERGGRAGSRRQALGYADGQSQGARGFRERADRSPDGIRRSGTG